MKKIRIITALALVLGLLLSLLLPMQANEPKTRTVYLEGAYKVNEKQIVFDFSEPIKVNQKLPWTDVRMTNKQGGIIGKYDKDGVRVGNYLWTAIDIRYVDQSHDKLLFTMVGSMWGCDGITDLLTGNGTFHEEPEKDAEIKKNLADGTYRFLLGMEELFLVTKYEYMADGMVKNFCAEADETVYLKPTRLTSGECVHSWLDELQPLPSSIKIDESKAEPLIKNQSWDFDIMAQGKYLPGEEPAEDLSADSETVKQVKNDPLIIAIILGAGVLVGITMIVIGVLMTKKKKGGVAR